jgi:hypothetical protein
MIFNSGKSVSDAPKLKNKRLMLSMKKDKYLKMTSMVTLVTIPAMSHDFRVSFDRFICVAKKKLIMIEPKNKKV